MLRLESSHYSLLQDRLFPEMRTHIFSFLSLEELVNAALVCREWKERVEEISFTPPFALLDFKGVRAGSETAAFIQNEWNHFEDFARSLDKSIVEKNFILNKARAIFELGVEELLNEYSENPDSQDLTFAAWVAVWSQKYSADCNLCAMLLTLQNISCQLNKGAAKEIKRFFLIFKKPDLNPFCQAIKLDYATRAGDAQFWNYLVKREPSQLLDSHLLHIICMVVRADENEEVLHLFLEAVREMGGLSKRFKKNVLRAIQAENEYNFYLEFTTYSHGNPIREPLSVKSVKGLIKQVEQRKSTDQKMGECKKRCLVQ